MGERGWRGRQRRQETVVIFVKACLGVGDDRTQDTGGTWTLSFPSRLALVQETIEHRRDLDVVISVKACLDVGDDGETE